MHLCRSVMLSRHIGFRTYTALYFQLWRLKDTDTISFSDVTVKDGTTYRNEKDN
jgi:hypothetical protein